MNEQTTGRNMAVSEEPHGADVPGNLYEFYLLLQTLKAGGISFDTFIERATTWAKLREAHNQRQ